MVSISSSAYARKSHGVKNKEGIRPKIRDRIKSFFGGHKNKTSRFGDGNNKRGKWLHKIKEFFRRSKGPYFSGGRGPRERKWPTFKGCWNFLKWLLLSLLLLFLVGLLLSWIFDFLGTRNKVKNTISNGVDSIKNIVSDKPYDFIVDEGSIGNYIGNGKAQVIPIASGYYEIITNDKTLVSGDVPLGTINIPKPITTFCSADSEYRNIISANSGLAYNEFVYDYLLGKKSGDIVIGILDSGIDPDNKELVGHIAKNSEEKNNNVDDDDNGYIDDLYGVNIPLGNGKNDDINGHGTHVAGIILQTFPNALLLPIKISEGDDDEIDDINIIKGLRYAIDSDVDIINMSFGGEGNNLVVNELINEAVEKGIIVVAAAGNESENVNIYYPANSSGVLSVGSISMTGTLSYFSNFGADILQPGECIYSNGLNDDMVFMNGTSMSSPHLAGALGTYLSLGNELTGESDIILLVNNSSRQVGNSSLLDIKNLLGLKNEIDVIDANLSSVKNIILDVQNNIEDIKNKGGLTDSIISKGDLNVLSQSALDIVNLYSGLLLDTGFAYDIKKLIDDYVVSLNQVSQKSIFLATEGGVLQGSLGLGLRGNKYRILIESGTVLPASGSHIVTNSISEREIKLSVYQGDNPNAVRNLPLGSGFVFKLSSRKPLGTAKLRVDFNVDKYGKLVVKAYESENTGNVLYPEIDNSVQRDSSSFSGRESTEILEKLEDIYSESEIILSRINKFYKFNPYDFIPEVVTGFYQTIKVNIGISGEIINGNTGFNLEDIENSSGDFLDNTGIDEQLNTGVEIQLNTGINKESGVNLSGTVSILSGLKSKINENIKVDSVIDGDTIRVFMNGESVKVRLIGVDAPESTDTRYGYIECFGNESTNYLKNLLSNKTIGLEYDLTQGMYDKYDRVLAYVFLNGENINKKIIEDGYGREYTYNLPYKYQKEFKSAQRNAESLNKGLWNVNTCEGDRKPNY